MKKVLLIFTLVSCMIMSVSIGAMASNVYVEGMVGGKWDNDINNTDGDSSGFAIGGEYIFLERYKVGLDYLKTTEEDMANDKDVDYASYQVKFGYRVIKKDNVNLDLTLGYYNENYDIDQDLTIAGIMVGADVDYSFNPQFSVNGSLGFSVNGSVDANGTPVDDNDATILLCKVQGNYHFADNWYGYAGYRYASSDIDDYDKITNSGPVLGVGFTF
jgi:hypothetical protein